MGKKPVCVLSELMTSTERGVTSRTVWDVRMSGWVSSQTKTEQCKMFQDLQDPALSSLANPSGRPLLCVWIRKGTVSAVACFESVSMHTSGSGQWKQGGEIHGNTTELWSLCLILSDRVVLSVFISAWWYQWKACLWKQKHMFVK